MENGGPGVPVVKSCCIDGLGSIKCSTCETIKSSKDIVFKNVHWQQDPPQAKASSPAKPEGPVPPDANLQPFSLPPRTPSILVLFFLGGTSRTSPCTVFTIAALSACVPLSSSSPPPIPAANPELLSPGYHSA